MKLLPVFIAFLMTTVLLSCGKSESKLASEKLQKAQTLYQQGDTTLALLQIDSIRMLYKGAIKEISAAGQLKKKIYDDLLYRKQDELDTLNDKISELEKNFITEKTEFDRYTQYIHKKQDFKRRWNKSYIGLHLDERGELSISSNYYGEQWLNHVAIRVYDGDLQAKTDTVALDDPLNHHSDFMNTKWEKVTYTKGKEKDVIQFIADHADRNLKAVFLGKRLYYIILEEYDKQAVIDVLNLSKALKQRAKLRKEVQDLQRQAS